METPTTRARIVEKGKQPNADASADASALTKALALVIVALTSALTLANQANADALVVALTSALALVEALTSGNDSGTTAPKKAEASDEEWKQGEYRKFIWGTTEQVRYKNIIDENGIEKCIRDDGCVAILVGDAKSYVSEYLRFKIRKEKIKKRDVLLFSPKIVECLLHPGSSNYDKAIMLHKVFLDNYPEMMTKLNEYTEHFGDLLPYGIISRTHVEYKEGMEIREHERLSDADRFVRKQFLMTFEPGIRIVWIPKGKPFTILDIEGDCLITGDNFQTA